MSHSTARGASHASGIDPHPPPPTTAPLREHALWYATALGWPVFPVRLNKTPLTAHGHLNATTDPAQIIRWWRQFPTASIGIRIPEGFSVLDVDPDKGGVATLKAMQDRHGPLPPSFTVVTGSGGRHIWFNGELKHGVNVFGPGLDTRVSGKGYVIAAPSPHPSGGRYQISDLPGRGDPTQIADVPPYLAAPPDQERKKAEPIDEEIPEGGREAAMVSLAGSLRNRGLGEEEIFDTIALVNERRCNPPLRDDELRRIAHSSMRYTAGSIVPDQRDPQADFAGFVDPNAVEPTGSFILNDKGVPIGDHPTNVRIALRKLGARLSYDQFADRTLLDGVAGYGPHLDDPAVKHLWLEARTRFGLKAPENIFSAVVGDEARRNSFHPVRQYLDAQTWDGVERLDRWLVTYGRAGDTEYVRAVGRLVLVAAVRRVRQPGVKFDEMLVLEQSQGTDKSTALSTLAVNPEWFNDGLSLNATAQRSIEATRGKWILESAELVGNRRAETAHLKAFLSRQVDRARMAYDRFAVDVPRQFIVIGSTNDRQYLRDSTGNRRFWPVRVEKFDVEALRRDRDQLWAEAAHREAQGESIRLAEELYADAGEQQEARRIEDPWADLLAEALGDREGKVAYATLYALLGIPAAQRSQQHSARVAEAMTPLGYERHMLKIDGTMARGFVKGPAPWRTIVLDGLKFRYEDEPSPDPNGEIAAFAAL